MTKRDHRTAVLALVALAVIGSAPAWTATYTIDPQHSQIQFRVRHLGISTVTGRFSQFEGKLVFDPERIEAAEVEAVIDATSIDTAVEARDEHLRSADFLNVDEHPEIRFASTGLKAVDDALRVSGELTIRGVTRPVVLEAEFNGQAADPWGNVRVGFEARTEIDRRDFGLTWNKLLETGGLLVSDEVEIVLVVQAIAQQPETRPAP